MLGIKDFLFALREEKGLVHSSLDLAISLDVSFVWLLLEVSRVLSALGLIPSLSLIFSTMTVSSICKFLMSSSLLSILDICSWTLVCC